MGGTIKLKPVVLLVLLMLVARVATAAPWLNPGDPRARYAVQKLADRGHLHSPVTTWPFMWSNIININNKMITNDYQSSGLAYQYLRFESEQQAPEGARVEVALAASQEPMALPSYSATSSDSLQAQFAWQWQGNRWAWGLSAAYENDPQDNKPYRLDESYLAVTGGGWVLGVGAINRWWGPGWQSSLMLSNSARPIPALWLSRAYNAAPEITGLHWLGPWDFTLMLGQLESQRVMEDAWITGARFVFRPASGLDIGLSRTAIAGGKGNPESGSAVWSALTETSEQQANDDTISQQLTAIDFRYGLPIKTNTLGLYGQLMESQDLNPADKQQSWLAGIDWTTQLLAGEQQWFVEYTTTEADKAQDPAAQSIPYEHAYYQSGYRYRGRNIATHYGGDSKSIALGSYHFFDHGGYIKWILNEVTFNQNELSRPPAIANGVFNYTPLNKETVSIMQLGYGTELSGFWLDIVFNIANKEVEYISGNVDRSSLDASIRYRF